MIDHNQYTLTLDELIEDLTDRILITHDRDDHGHWSFGELPTDAAARIQAYVDACVNEAQRWIPVTEQLPELCIPVLTWSSYGEHDFEWLLGYDNDGQLDWSRSFVVTHWQPLPPPPPPSPVT